MIGLLIAVVCLALFPLFQGRFYATGDTRDVFIPLEIFFHEETLSGRLPAWNPNISWGFPVIASAQIGFFYPPLLLTRWLPIWIYLPLNLAAHLIAMALGTYLFLRKLNRSQSGAYLGAISFTLGAFIFQHLTHLNIIFAIAWFPFQLLWGKNFSPPYEGGVAVSGRRGVFLLAALIGIPFLAGQIQIPLLMAIVTSVYFLHSYHSSVIRKLASLSAVAVLAIGLAAAQLFPTAELALHSTRGQDNDFNLERANQYSWPLYHLPTVLFPRFFDNDDTYWGKKLELEYGFFIGTIPLLLAFMALIHPHLISPSREGEKQRGFFRWLVIISFLLALGSLSPFRLVSLEPSLWFFSAPARWLLFTTFGLSTLAAYGWDYLLPLFYTSEVSAKRTPRRWSRVAFGLATIILIVNLILFLTPNSFFQFLTKNQPEYYRQKISSLITSAKASSVSLLSPFTTLPVVILIAAPFLLKRRFGKQVLLGAATVELILIVATANPTFAWKEIIRQPEIVEALPESVISQQARLYSLRDFEDTGALLTNPEGRFFDRLHNEPKRLLLPIIHAQFNLPGVVWPASLDLSNQAQVVHQLKEALKIGDTKLAEELNISAILLPSPQAGRGDGGEVEIKGLESSPRASLLLSDGTETPAEYQQLTPSHIQIKIHSDQPATLLIRDTFYPGWQATLDSTRRVELVPAGPNSIFRTVAVPPGAHTIDMRFRPAIQWAGIMISALSLLFTLAYSVKPHKQPSSPTAQYS